MVGARHRHHVTGAEAVEHGQKLAPCRRAARDLLVVDVAARPAGGAELVELRVEGLPIGRDAGMAVISYSKRNPLTGRGKRICRKS